MTEKLLFCFVDEGYRYVFDPVSANKSRQRKVAGIYEPTEDTSELVPNHNTSLYVVWPTIIYDEESNQKGMGVDFAPVDMFCVDDRDICGPISHQVPIDAHPSAVLDARTGLVHEFEQRTVTIDEYIDDLEEQEGIKVLAEESGLIKHRDKLIA